MRKKTIYDVFKRKNHKIKTRPLSKYNSNGVRTRTPNVKTNWTRDHRTPSPEQRIPIHEGIIGPHDLKIWQIGKELQSLFLTWTTETKTSKKICDFIAYVVWGKHVCI